MLHGAIENGFNAQIRGLRRLDLAYADRRISAPHLLVEPESRGILPIWCDQGVGQTDAKIFIGRICT